MSKRHVYASCLDEKCLHQKARDTSLGQKKGETD